MNLSDKIKSLPTSPGVYLFKDKTGQVIYVGKAASLKDRVRSYFNGQNYYARPIDFYIDQIADVEFKLAETVLEAYFLEQDLIKRLQPKYNVLGKDDKSFVYVCVTKEEFPRFEVKRKTDLTDIRNKGNQNFESLQEKKKQYCDIKSAARYSRIYGPYTSRYLIEQALKILRRIFPYHNKPQKTEKGCLDYHLGFCPGPYAGRISKEDYRKNIRAIEMILKGKKKDLVRSIEKEMEDYSKKQEYEKAAKARNLLFTLRHIQDVALIRSENSNDKFEIPHPKSEINSNSKIQIPKEKTKDSLKISTFKLKIYRIEGYDISNISGTSTVGSMVVFDNEEGEWQANKKEYRKFRIKTIKGANDVSSMDEMLRRRFKNAWKRPDLILLDGGKGHLNMARRVLRDNHLDVPLLAVAKGPTRKKLDFYYYGTVPAIPKNVIEQVRDEAHRFAIGYHRKLRKKNLELGK